MSALIQRRLYQQSVFRHDSGVLALIWRRQAGKSTILGDIGLDWMMETPGTSVIYSSASLRLGAENLLKELQTWQEGIRLLRKLMAEAEMQITTSADDDKGDLLDLGAIEDLFVHNKLETRLWFDNATYSRSATVAPNPDTAVGWTGHVILDEVGRMPQFKDLWEAMEPIVSSSQRFRIRLSTTPPPDDKHHSYELLCPTIEQFPVNPAGNFYTSSGGILCHRLDAYDGEAAGVPIYDLKTREPLTAEVSLARAIDKQAWLRNYGVRFLRGGTSALSLTALMQAQTLGLGEGMAVLIQDEIDLRGETA